MTKVTMVMPMAGRGSRFNKANYLMPKPLIEIFGKPLFFWASKGLLDVFPDAELKFIVLEEHINNFQIDKEIMGCFPAATIFSIDSVTGGALETVMAAKEIIGDNFLIINDCDHAFKYSRLQNAVESLTKGNDAFLTNFSSQVPHFSYSRYAENGGLLLETREKDVISSSAIAGIYGFRNLEVLTNNFYDYRSSCPYNELYISGIYNEIVKKNGKVFGFEMDCHFSMGTPEEFSLVAKDEKNFISKILKKP